MPTTNPVYALVDNYLGLVQNKLPSTIFTTPISRNTSKETSATYYFLPLTNATLPATTEIPAITWNEHHFSIFADSDKAHGKSLYHYTLTGTHQRKAVRFHVYFNKAGNMVEVKQGKDSTLAFTQLSKTTQTQITEFAIQASTQFLHTVSTIREEKIAALKAEFECAEQELSDLVEQSQATSLAAAQKSTLASSLEKKATQCKDLLESIIAIAESAKHFVAQEKSISLVAAQAKATLRDKADKSKATTSISSQASDLPATPVNPDHTTIEDTTRIDPTPASLIVIKATIAELEAIKNIEKTPAHFSQLHNLYEQAIDLASSKDFNLQMQLFRKLNQLPKMATTIFHIHVSKKDVAQAQSFISHLGDLPLPILVKAIVTAVDNDDAAMLTMLHQQTQFPVDYVLLASDITSGNEGLRLKERAAEGGKYNALTTLLVLGANPNASVHGLGISFAGWLATQGHAEALRIAHSFGADVNYIYSSSQAQQKAKEKLGNSGGHNGLARKQHDALQQANSLGGINHGHSILSLAAMHGQFAICLVLLELGAHKQQQDNLGRTQLISVCNSLFLKLHYLLLPMQGSAAAEYKQKYLPSSYSLSSSLPETMLRPAYTLDESIRELMAVVELLYQLAVVYPDKHIDKQKAIYNIACLLKIFYEIHTDTALFSAPQCTSLNTQVQRVKTFIVAIPTLEDAAVISQVIKPILAQPFHVIESDTPTPKTLPSKELRPRVSVNVTIPNTQLTTKKQDSSKPTESATSSTSTKPKALMPGSNRFSLFSCNACTKAAIVAVTTIGVAGTLVTAALLKRS
jgi:ankyrin repeat protein